MISYVALGLAVLGIIWTIFIITRLLVKKQTKPKKSFFKAMFKSLMPFNAQSYPRESLEFLFSQALRTLQVFIPSKNYKYHLPWYAALGAEGVGKTTFFKSLNLEAPIDSNEFCSERSLCYWHFFNGGVFLDFKGEMIRKNETMPISNEQDWNRVLNLLSKVRSAKGLDGILVFLSVEDLIGPSAKSEAQLVQDAEYMYSKLWQLQKMLELKLPVYIVFTHLDSISGFKEFSKAIPANLLQDIFGWSNSYSLDSTFQGNWIDNMFDSMGARIDQLQGEIFVGKDAECNAHVLEFFAQFRSMCEPLKLYMEHLFQDNTYAAGYFLRGIYFVGGEYALEADQESQWPKMPDKKKALSLNVQHYMKHLFATNIITKKVLLEKNLGRLVGGANPSYRMQVKFMQLSIASFIVTGVVYLSQTYMKLEAAMGALNPRVARVVQMLEEHKNNHLKMDDATLMQEAQQLLNAIVNISSINLRFAFIPTSWISTLEYRLWNLLEKSNDVVIVKALFKRIEEKYKALAETDISDINKESLKSIHNLSNPLEHPVYIKLHNYIGKMVELNQIQQKFVSASENGNVHSFAWLIKKLIGIEIPRRFYGATRVFTQALKDNTISISHLPMYETQIKKNVQVLFDHFVDHAFVLQNFIENFNQLQDLLYSLENNQKSFTINHLRTLSMNLANLITFVNGTEFSWIQHTSLKLKKYIGLMQHVEQLPVLGRDFQKTIMARVNHKYLSLKVAMQGVKLPVVGNMFYLDEDNRLKLTDNLVEMQGLLNGLFSQKFMGDWESKVLAKVDYGKTVIWNVDILNAVSDVFASYDEFIAKKVQNYPAHLVRMLRVVSKQNLDRIITAKLCDAQQVMALEYSEANIVTLAENVKASYGAITAILKRARDLDMGTYAQLLEIEKKRAMQVVSQADEMLEKEDLYSIEGNTICMDHLLKNKLYFAIDMQDYLMTQKNKITHFAKDIIEPVLKTLLFIDNMDNSTMNSKLHKWSGILKAVDSYDAQNQSSEMFQLEAFLKDLTILRPEQLHDVLANNGQLKIQSDNYFQQKMVNVKRQLFVHINAFTRQAILDNCERSLMYYNQNAKFFPFALYGDLLPFDQVVALDNLVKDQQAQLDVIRKIDPKLKMPDMKFVEGLESMNKFVQFLTQPGGVLQLTFKSPSELSDSLEKNLEYLVSACAIVGQTMIYFPDSGQLKVNDRIVFKFKLANQSGVNFGPVKEKGYAVSSQEVIVTLGKEDIIRLFLQNSVTRNGQTVLKFELPIIDASGIKKRLIVAMPVEIAEEGGLPFKFPEAPMSVLANGVKV